MINLLRAKDIDLACSNVTYIIIGDETSQTSWRDEFAMAGNPNMSNIVVSESLVYTMVCKEVLYCFSKVIYS